MTWKQRNNTIFNNIFVDGNREQINYTNGGSYFGKIRLLRNIFYSSVPNQILYRVSGWHVLPMESDYNLLFHTKGKDFVIIKLPYVKTLEDWKELGFETNSIIADPLFVDLENDDYSLKPESPALKMGFKPIDLSRVGLRGTKYQ